MHYASHWIILQPSTSVSPDAEVLVFCFQKIFLHQLRCWWVPGTVQPAAGPEVEPAFLQLVGTFEIGALLGTSEVGLTAGTSEAETLEVVKLAGISGVEPLSVAGIFEVQQFPL